MKSLIKAFLIKTFNPIITRLGYVKLERNNKNNLLNNLYSVLKDIGFTPKHIVDIGAHHGTWTRETLTHFPNSYYTLLEPQYWLKDSIGDILHINPKVQFHAVGAGNKTGTFKFTIVDRDDSSTFNMTEQQAKENGYKQIDLPVVTLNELLSVKNLPVPDIIKIDAEGLDIKVLEGADSFLGTTEIFLIEASVGNKQFENSVYNVLSFMDKYGYRLFDITDLNRPFKPNILWLVELVFIKKGGIIDTYKVF